MNNVHFEAVKQIAATCAALKILLAGGREIARFQVCGGTGFPEMQSDQIAVATKRGVSTLIITFQCEGDDALVDKMLLFSVSKSQQLTISYCSFVQNEDGSHALRLMNRDRPEEFVFSRSSGRLVCRKVEDDRTRAMAELNGLQALVAKAGEPVCRQGSFQVG